MWMWGLYGVLHMCVCVHLCAVVLCVSVGDGGGGGMHDGERDYVVYVSAYCVRI